MPNLVLVSPHPDDICFSAFLAAAAAGETKRHLVTVFSGSRFWLRPSRDISGPAEIGAIRGAEDLEFARLISATRHDLGYPDSSLRFSHGGPEFHTLPEADPVFGPVCGSLGGIVDRLAPCAAVYVPIGISSHVDHLICRDAVLLRRLSCPVVFYEDLPYISRCSDERIAAFLRGLPFRVTAESLVAPDGGRAKLAALGIYGTQLEADTAELIRRHAERVAGPGGFAERYWRAESVPRR